MTDELLLFPDRASFREWLSAHTDHPGAWLIFSKSKKLKTLTAAEALEEALCFGWIDGQMESIDETRYRKYFSPRRAQSKWSDKNRKLAEKLEAEGLMTDAGRAKIEEAKKNGSYEGNARMTITDGQVEALRRLLSSSETALTNFDSMTPSVRRTYTGAYFSTKTESGRAKKLVQLIERLELNLNPMESLAKKKAEECTVINPTE